MTTQTFDIVTFIDNHFMLAAAATAIVFAGITYILYKFAIQAHFGETFPKEKLQLLANLDTKKKEKKPVQKATKKKGKNKNGQNTDSTETSDETSTTSTIQQQPKMVESVGIEPTLKAPERTTPVESENKNNNNNNNNKKKNKAKKLEAEAPKKENIIPEPIEEIIEKLEIKIEEAEKQQAAAPTPAAPAAVKEKNRKKRAAVPQAPQEVITNLDEDKFITRIASINELQPEYLSFITEFINHVHNERFEFGSVRDQVHHLQTKMRDNEKIVQNKDGEIIKIRNELSKTQKSALETKSRIDELTHQLQATQKSLYETRQPKPNEELEKLRKEHFDLKARLQAASEHAKEVEKLKGELNQAKKTLSQPTVDHSLQQRLKELENKLAKSEEAVAHSNESLKTLQNENKNLRDREQQISAEVDALTREIDEIQHVRIEKENFAQAPDNSEELNKLKQEIDELENKNDMCNGAIAKLNIELRKSYSETMEHKKDRDDMKERFETLSNEKKDLAKKLDIAEKKLEDFTQYYETSTNKIRELENELNSLELEKNDLKKQLIEEREHIDKLEDSLATQTNATKSSSSSDNIEKVKELETQIEALSVEKQDLIKTLDITEKKLGDFTDNYEGTSSKTSELEKELATVTAKKEELHALNMRLVEKVHVAEEQATKVLKESDERKVENLRQLVAALSTSLKSANVKISETSPKTEEEFTQWIQALPNAIKSVISEHKPTVTIAAEQTSKKDQSQTNNNNDEEAKKLRTEVKRLEKIIETLAQQLDIIEKAYSEKEAELKAELNALEKNFQSSKPPPPTLVSPGSLASSSTADSAEWELVQ